MGTLADFFDRQSIVLPQAQKREMLSLDKKFSDMEAEVEILKTDNLRLKAQVKPLEREIEGLKQQIQRQSAPPRSLDQAKEAALRMLNEHPRSLTEEVAGFLEMSEEAAKFHLESLQEMSMVNWGVNPRTGGISWYLEQGGREYLHAKGWLK